MRSLSRGTENNNNAAVVDHLSVVADSLISPCLVNISRQLRRQADLLLFTLFHGFFCVSRYNDVLSLPVCMRSRIIFVVICAEKYRAPMLRSTYTPIELRDTAQSCFVYRQVRLTESRQTSLRDAEYHVRMSIQYSKCSAHKSTVRNSGQQG